MARDIEGYLKDLQAALMREGADPALVQDALFDAEEYLRAEMAEGGVADRGTATYEERFVRMIEGYGSAEEVAAAYLGAPRMTDQAEIAAAAAEMAGMADEADTVSKGAARTPPTAPPTPTTTATATITPLAPTAGLGAPRSGTLGEPGRETPQPSATPTGQTVPAGVAAGTAAAAAGKQPSAWEQVFGVVVDPAVYKALLYMLLSLATGIAYFTIVVTGVSASGGMLVLIIGIPLFLLVLGIVRVMALFEGQLVEALLGTRMPRRERAGLPNANLLERMWYWVKDGRTWASMAYMILMLPLGIVYFTVAVTGLAAGFGLIVSPFTYWARDHVFVWHGVEYTWHMPLWATPLAVVAGVVVLLLCLHLARWIGRGHAAFAKRMLVRLSS
jgi:hypothetical protein